MSTLHELLSESPGKRTRGYCVSLTRSEQRLLKEAARVAKVSQAAFLRLALRLAVVQLTTTTEQDVRGDG